MRAKGVPSQKVLEVAVEKNCFMTDAKVEKLQSLN
jgi:hypothetical protein